MSGAAETENDPADSKNDEAASALIEVEKRIREDIHALMKKHTPALSAALIPFLDSDCHGKRFHYVFRSWSFLFLDRVHEMIKANLKPQVRDMRREEVFKLIIEEVVKDILDIDQKPAGTCH